VKAAVLAAVVTTFLALGPARPAHARNPHCAGGIQYVVQSLRDKDRGAIDDYKREIMKAVQQLEMCASEDPNDFEAIGYLGWAYAEVESAGPSGRMFKRAIDGLKAKGDVKKAELVKNNQESYWTNAFNNGISKINASQAAYPNFLKAPENDAEKTQKAEAAKKFAEGLESMTRASLLKPGDPRSYRSIGSIHAFMGNYVEAEAAFKSGLAVAPGDSDLVDAIRQVRTRHAGQLIDDKKYDEAVAYYTDLIKAMPSDGDLRLGLAEAYFKRAESRPTAANAPTPDTGKVDFKLAGDAYAKGGELKPDNADLPFNAALAYTRAGEHALAEAQWREALKRHPDDPEIWAPLGATLAELKKFDEAIKVLHQAVTANPKNKNFHRQLGQVYRAAGNEAKDNQETMVFLAMVNGKPAADAAAQAKKASAGTDAAKTLSTSGAPAELYVWDAQGEQYETWFYWDKKTAYHFKQGREIIKSDWNASDLKPARPTANKK